MAEKRCTKCDEVKLLGEFQRCARVLDGRKARCRDCSNEDNKAWYAANSEAAKAYSRQYYAENQDHIKSSRQEHKEERNAKRRKLYQTDPKVRESRDKSGSLWRENNRDRHNASKRERRAKNPERAREMDRDYRKRNPDMFRAIDAKQKAKKKERYVAWANLETIKKIYDTCPRGWHVDHIIPLQGENVSGLHVAENLQHLPASENMSKGNRYG